jgi:hypothetical protein
MRTFLIALAAAAVLLLLFAWGLGRDGADPAAVLSPDTDLFLSLQGPEDLQAALGRAGIWRSGKAGLRAGERLVDALHRQLARTLGNAPLLDVKALLHSTGRAAVARVRVRAGEPVWVIALVPRDPERAWRILRGDLDLAFAPTKEVEGLYRAPLVETGKTLWAAEVGGCLVIAPSKEPARWALRIHTGPHPALAGTPAYRMARRQVADRTLAWGYVRNAPAEGTHANTHLPEGIDTIAASMGRDGTIRTHVSLAPGREDRPAASTSWLRKEIAGRLSGLLPSAYLAETLPATAEEEATGETALHVPGREGYAPPGPEEEWSLFDVVLAIVLVPVGLVGLVILAIVGLAVYFYIHAWVTGNPYEHTVVEPASLSPAAASELGVAPDTEAEIEESGDASAGDQEAEPDEAKPSASDAEQDDSGEEETEDAGATDPGKEEERDR